MVVSYSVEWRGSCKHVNDISDFVKVSELTERLSNSKLLKMDSVFLDNSFPWLDSERSTISQA
jgi:hypothetical protein